MLPAIPFYIIRHGESVANVEQYASGHVDVPLTERGIAQAHEAKKAFICLEVKPTIIIHSHLQRARNTARIINEVLNLEMVEDPEIAEQHYGDWEGVHWDKTRQSIRDGIDPPNGETHTAFHSRVKNAITRFVETYPPPALIVCHGGVFRAIGALYNEKIVGIDNCTLHHFEPNSDVAAAAFPWYMRKL